MRRLTELRGELEQSIRFTSHRGYHDHNTVAVFTDTRDAISHRSDPLNRAD
jgi:hypothetical protein